MFSATVTLRSAAGFLAAVVVSLCWLGGCDGDTKHSQASAGATPEQPHPGGGDASQRFDGVFHSSADGSHRILNISERSGRVTGMMGSAAIDARVSEEHAEGQLKDPATGANMGGVEMSLDGDRLVLAMTVLNPQSGQSHPLPPITFTRGAPPPVDVLLDTQLVGRWRSAPPATAPAHAAPPSTWLILSADGSVGHGRSSAGVEPTIASIPSSGDDGFTGRWRSGDGVLHVMPLGTTQWIAFARYDVEGDQLVLTYNSGASQGYRRQ